MGRGPVGAPALIKYNDQSISAVTEIAAAAKDAMVLITTVTASDDSSTDFVHGTNDVVLDSTYPVYLFKFINIHPGTNDKEMHIYFTTDGTNWNASKTTTWFNAVHDAAETYTGGPAYNTNRDVQGTGAQTLTQSVGNENDESCSGEMWLFNPSSTTFVKHFLTHVSTKWEAGDAESDDFGAGYVNTTSAVTGVRFIFNSGNIDSCTFKLYGIKDS